MTPHRFQSFPIRALFVAALLISLVGISQGAEPDAPVKQQNLDSDHLALKGYDPVSYFESKAAAKGSDKYVGNYQGAIYHFASADHQKKFLDSPTKFLPTYGGWCATAMADGDKVDIDPTNFKLTDGRLFLFYKGWLGDAKKTWDKDENAMKVKADASWKKILAEK